jgi:hypothetical protein
MFLDRKLTSSIEAEIHRNTPSFVADRVAVRGKGD